MGGSGVSVGFASVTSVMVVAGSSVVQAVRVVIKPNNKNRISVNEKEFVDDFIDFLRFS